MASRACVARVASDLARSASKTSCTAAMPAPVPEIVSLTCSARSVVRRPSSPRSSGVTAQPLSRVSSVSTRAAYPSDQVTCQMLPSSKHAVIPALLAPLPTIPRGKKLAHFTRCVEQPLVHAGSSSTQHPRTLITTFDAMDRIAHQEPPDGLSAHHVEGGHVLPIPRYQRHAAHGVRRAEAAHGGS